MVDAAAPTGGGGGGGGGLCLDFCTGGSDGALWTAGDFPTCALKNCQGCAPCVAALAASMSPRRRSPQVEADIAAARARSAAAGGGDANAAAEAPLSPPAAPAPPPPFVPPVNLSPVHQAA